jgi:hypothetical protein
MHSDRCFLQPIAHPQLSGAHVLLHSFCMCMHSRAHDMASGVRGSGGSLKQAAGASEAQTANAKSARRSIGQHPHVGEHVPSLHTSVPVPLQHPPATPPWCEQQPEWPSGTGVGPGLGAIATTINNAHTPATTRPTMAAPPDRKAYGASSAGGKERPAPRTRIQRAALFR